MAIRIYYGNQIYYWDSKSFYEKAMPKDITNCLQAGADLNARDERERSTPCIWQLGTTKIPPSSIPC